MVHIKQLESNTFFIPSTHMIMEKNSSSLSRVINSEPMCLGDVVVSKKDNESVARKTINTLIVSTKYSKHLNFQINQEKVFDMTRKSY